jgi:hypothetical protein
MEFMELAFGKVVTVQPFNRFTAQTSFPYQLDYGSLMPYGNNNH